MYSLATQHEGLWLCSGLESGGINLQSVRVEEGKIITCLRGHSSAVSVLSLAQDERSLLSGSWDKTVLDWDLNTGQVIRNFEGSGGQISALESRPLSTLPVPPTVDDFKLESGTFSSDSAEQPRKNGTDISFQEEENGQSRNGAGETGMGTAASPTDSLFGGGDADSLFGDDDEFSKAIANGIREQEQVSDDQQIDKPQLADGDIEMGLFNEDTTSITIDGGLLDSTSKEMDTFENSEAQLGALDASSEPKSQLPHSDEIPSIGDIIDPEPPQLLDTTPKADSTFLAASRDGSIRVWDKRQPKAVAKMTPRNVPPWCMNATWSPDGNLIFAGRRNGTVDEYNLHKGLQTASRSFKLPNNSGAVSALKAMPNGRHLLW